MAAGERAAWYPAVSIKPPITEVRNDRGYKEIRGAPLDFNDGVTALSHAELFKVFFGWLGSAEVNLGLNSDELDIAHRALLQTVDCLVIQGDLTAAWSCLYADLETDAMLCGPRDYVYTVATTTRAACGLRYGRACICPSCERHRRPIRPHSLWAYTWTTGRTSYQSRASAAKLYLFLLGELLGIPLRPCWPTLSRSPPHLRLPPRGRRRRLAHRGLPQRARHFLPDGQRFELERMAAFVGKLPLQGVARAKGACRVCASFLLKCLGRAC